MTVERVTPIRGNTLKDVAVNYLNRIVSAATYPGENILHDYRTFNYRVTLAIVSPEEFRSGSYKTAGFTNVIFSSYGKGNGANIKSNSQTLNKAQELINVLNQSTRANYDYYLEDLYIKNFISSARDWTTEIRLKIVEPYSIDTFLNNIITALTVKGYKNFDKSNAFVLKIDFVGYHEDSTEPETVPYSTRYYPMIITNMDAKLTQQGTTWEIVGAPINQSGMYDDLNKIPQDISVSGNTVKEVLQDLELALKEIKDKSEADSNFKFNEYKIVFLDEKGKIVDSNEFGDAKMFDTIKDAGTRKFNINSLTVGTVGNDPENVKMALNIPGSMGLTRIIDSIIQDSYYVYEQLKDQFVKARDPAGWVKWWRVVTKVDIGEYDSALNRQVRKVTFQIVPRKVHYSKLTSIFQPNYKPAAKDYESMTARRYEWYYTGKNKDIISFNLNFNQMWTKIVTGTLGKGTDVPGAATNNKLDNSAGVVAAPQGQSTPEQFASNTTPDYNSGQQKGAVRSSQEPDPLFTIQRDINALMNNPYENVTLNMEILGDPMWLGTQFIDDGSKIDPSFQLFTNDGGIALRSVDPTIRVVAYAPTDINAQGFLTSGEANEDKALSKISSYYTVYEIESTFTGGIFKQKLVGARNVVQDLAAQEKILQSQDRFTLKNIDLSIRK